MSITTVDHITINSASEYVANIPNLVGFQPTDSLVSVLVKSQRVVVTIRIDIPVDWVDFTEMLLRTADSLEADAVLLSVHTTTETANGLRLAESVRQLADTLTDNSIQVLEALLVTDELVKSLLNSLRMSEGYEIQITSGLFPACEMSVTDSQLTREQVVARYAPQESNQVPSQAFTEAAKKLSSDPKLRAENAWETLNEIVSQSQSSSNRNNDAVSRALLIMSVHDVRVRDYVLAKLAHTENSPLPLVDAIVETALRAPTEFRVKMAGMAAASLRAFNPSSIPASCLADLGQDDTLARLVRESLHAPIPPSAMRAVLVESLPLVLAQLEGNQ